MAAHNLHRRNFFKGQHASENKLPIFPPWSLSYSEFIKTCERCDCCCNVCPEKIIYKGVGGFPEVDFTRGECTFCGKCLLSCQSNAFIQQKKYRATEAWPEQHIHISSKCLSMNAIMCRSCADSCETDAIQFQIKLKGVSEPLIAIDKCIGCGVCIYVCPNQSIEMVSQISNTDKPIPTAIKQPSM